jgi:hypothetical protein
VNRNLAIGILLAINVTFLALIAGHSNDPVEVVTTTAPVPVDTLTAEQLLDIMRDVSSIDPDTTEELDYQCWLTLRQYDDTDAAVAAHYIAMKWEGDTCAALHHHLDHGWH